jgi:hypothetical protein
VKPMLIKVGRKALTLEQLDAMCGHVDIKRLYAAVDAKLRLGRRGKTKGGRYFT